MNTGQSQIFVLGSINMDIVAQVERHPRPGETLPGTDLSYFPGGKGANQAVAAGRAGGSVAMVGAVGSDAFGLPVIAFLKENGLDVSQVRELSDSPTGTALILVDSRGENSIVVVPGANGRVESGDIDLLSMAKGDVLVSQLETPVEVAREFFRRGAQAGATRIFNPAPAQELDSDFLSLLDVLVVNEHELSVVSGLELTDSPTRQEILDARHALLSRGFNKCLVATLGSRGAMAFVGDRVIEIQGVAVEVVDTTGAGDCFVGNLAQGLAEGHDIDRCLQDANRAAAFCVGRPGAGPSMPRPEDLQAFTS